MCAYYREAVFIPPSDECVAVAALFSIGGLDTSLVSAYMLLTDFGWGLWEEELRHVASGTLPSWIISSVRGGMRSELVLCSYGINPRVGELIGVGINSFSRIQRLVLIGNALGGQGCAGLVRGIVSAGCPVRDLFLDKCNVGDEGALAIAAILRESAYRSLIQCLQLEENNISDEGALGFAEALENGVRFSDLRLGGNCISDSACAVLDSTARKHRVNVCLSSRFFPKQLAAPESRTGASRNGPPHTWRAYSTPHKRLQFPTGTGGSGDRKAKESKRSRARRWFGLD